MNIWLIHATSINESVYFLIIIHSNYCSSEFVYLLLFRQNSDVAYSDKRVLILIYLLIRQVAQISVNCFDEIFRKNKFSWFFCCKSKHWPWISSLFHPFNFMKLLEKTLCFTYIRTEINKNFYSQQYLLQGFHKCILTKHWKKKE